MALPDTLDKVADPDALGRVAELDVLCGAAELDAPGSVVELDVLGGAVELGALGGVAELDALDDVAESGTELVTDADVDSDAAVLDGGAADDDGKSVMLTPCGVRRASASIPCTIIQGAP